MTEYPKNKPIRIKGARLYRLYHDVFNRDNYTCQECGTTANIEKAPHHVIFKSQGGSDTMENLVTLCQKCHGLKHGIIKII